MFCPKCATQNVDGAKFCRSCGADISLVPQALAGHVPAQPEQHDADELSGRSRSHRRRRGRDKEPPSVEKGVQSLIMGIGFVLVSLCVRTWMPGGFVWWFWLLIPAFAMLGEGVATMMRASRAQKQLAPPQFSPAPNLFHNAPPRANEQLPPLNTGELMPTPPSVTEATTRHLGIPVERKSKDA